MFPNSLWGLRGGEVVYRAFQGAINYEFPLLLRLIFSIIIYQMYAILGVPYENRHYMDIHKATLLGETGLIKDIANVVLLNMIDIKCPKLSNFEDKYQQTYYGISYSVIQFNESYISLTPLPIQCPPKRLIRFADQNLYNYEDKICPDSGHLKIVYGIKIFDTGYDKRNDIYRTLDTNLYSLFYRHCCIIGINIYDSKHDYVSDTDYTKTYDIENYSHNDAKLKAILKEYELTAISLPMLFQWTYN
jgi:hypothetical protein